MWLPWRKKKDQTTTKVVGYQPRRVLAPAAPPKSQKTVDHLRPLPQLAEFSKAIIDSGDVYTADRYKSIPVFEGAGYLGAGCNSDIASWFLSRGFIGYQMCAVIGAHWLVDKACGTLPGDALRNGWEVLLDEEDEQHIDLIGKFDKKFNTPTKLREYLHFAHVFGGQLAMFNIVGPVAIDYEAPFNIESVTPGSYRGFIRIDPVDVTPGMTAGNVNNPTSDRYLEPEYWIIRGKKYHHSHFVKCVPCPVAKISRQLYNHFGVSVPERIFERVHAAERSANEVPELLFTKRSSIIKTPSYEAGTSVGEIEAALEPRLRMRNNHGVLVLGSDDDAIQLETALANLDEVVTGQYLLVAAATGIPVTKLMGEAAKGLNATGEGDAENYRHLLEDVQTSLAEPLLLRHYQLLARSLEIETDVEIQWPALDSPDAKEYAEIEEIEARTDAAYMDRGVVSPIEVREKRLSTNKESCYYGLKLEDDPAFTDPADLGEYPY